MARPASDIRERLLDSALTHFAAVGVDAASMRSIASDAGTSVGMISYHFESKDGLFLALVDQFYEPFTAQLEGIAAANDDPVGRLRALLGRIANLTDQEKRAARAMLRELSVQSERIATLMPRFLQGHVRLLLQALHEAVSAGAVRDDLPLMTMLPSVFAPFLAPQVLGLYAFMGIDPAQAIESSLEVIFRGLLPREPPEPSGV